MKKILFVLSKPPHHGAYIQETLDIIMTCAAFDQEVSVLLLDKAVFHLKQNQQPESAGLKDTASMYKALPLYNVNTVYAETESLRVLGLCESDLSEAILQIPRLGLGDFFKAFDVVLSG